jgi:hypothetical protein
MGPGGTTTARAPAPTMFPPGGASGRATVTRLAEALAAAAVAILVLGAVAAILVTG